MQNGLLVPSPPPTPEQHPSPLAMGSVHRGKDHMEDRLEYSRTLMSEKSEKYHFSGSQQDWEPQRKPKVCGPWLWRCSCSMEGEETWFPLGWPWGYHVANGNQSKQRKWGERQSHSAIQKTRPNSRSFAQHHVLSSWRSFLSGEFQHLYQARYLLPE